MDFYYQRVYDTINKNASLMFRNKNIIGIGRCFKIIDGCKTRIPSLTLFVKEKVSKDMLSRDDIIPKHINGCITDILECEEVSGKAMYKDFLAKDIVRPSYGGLSIGVVYDKDDKEKKLKTTEGTIGCAVVKKMDSITMYFFLTSFTTLSNYSKKHSILENSVYQPPIAYSDWERRKNFEIGKYKGDIELREFTEENQVYNEMNAGLVHVGLTSTPFMEKRIKPGICNNKQFEGIKDALEDGLSGKKMFMCCRNNIKSGEIFSESVFWKSKLLDLEGKELEIRYTKQVMCKIDCEIKDYGTIGYIVEEGKNYAFGLLWNSSLYRIKSGEGKVKEQFNVGLFSPMKRVTELLNVTIMKE